jgi:replicative DNA helicase
MLGKKSVEKAIPDAIFSLPTAELGVFVGRLWSCDGCVDKRGQVSYSTGSRKMAEQVQHLLLRFGVTSHIRILPRGTKDGTRDYYEVIVHRERIEQFKRHVKLIGPKAERIKEVRFQGRSRIGWIRNEELRDEIRAEMDARPDLLPEVGEELGYGFKFQKGHVVDSRSGRIRKRVFAAFCEVYDSPLAWVLDENIQWDEIVKIEEIGPRPCLDIAVPETECFLAGDVITHNTWILLAWADHVRKQLEPGEKILVASGEMPDTQIFRRLFAIRNKLCYQDFRAGRLTAPERQRFFDFCEEMLDDDPDRAGIHVADPQFVSTIEDIVDKAAEINAKAVFLDGLYCFAPEMRAALWERVIAATTATKKLLCGGLKIPVVATTQLKGSLKRGDLGADVDSDSAAFAKAIGDWADAVRGVFGDRDYIKNKQRAFRGMETREFEPLDILMHFNLNTMNFDEIKVLDPVGGDKDKEKEEKEEKEKAEEAKVEAEAEEEKKDEDDPPGVKKVVEF